MAPQCHTVERAGPASPPRAAAPNRVEDADLLAAARECVLARGVRRSTLTEIARRAGVSRMTLYRRFPDVHSVVTALITGEFTANLRRARVEAGTGTARERLVRATVRCVELLRSDPLLRRVLATDPDMLLPYLVERLGTAQRAAEAFATEYLVEGHREGSIRRGDPSVQSRALLLAAQSFVISALPAAVDVDTGSLTDELTVILDAALRPVPLPEETG